MKTHGRSVKGRDIKDEAIAEIKEAFCEDVISVINYDYEEQRTRKIKYRYTFQLDKNIQQSLREGR